MDNEIELDGTTATMIMTHMLVKVRQEAGRSFHSNKKSLAVAAVLPDPEIRSEDLSRKS